MIQVKNLTKVYKSHQRQDNFLADLFFRKYKETMALDKISFEIGNNELVGFIGPNGA
jgi:ABC-2 type transport system ATP-binding protein